MPVTAGAPVAGNTVTVTWPDAVGANGTYAIVAGTGPGLSNIATLVTGATRELVTDAPAGVYYVRVVAIPTAGVSPSRFFAPSRTGPTSCDVTSPSS